jgi:hypothetical protein
MGAPLLEFLLNTIRLFMKIAEYHRDARWDLMALAASRRPDNAPLPEMSIGALRKLAASR